MVDMKKGKSLILASLMFLSIFLTGCIGLDSTVDPRASLQAYPLSIQEGETLTLDTSTIQDEDGPTSLSFTYTWHRSSDGDNWTAISNATSSSYTIVDADAHHEIMAKASYTDAYLKKEIVESEVTSKIDPGNGSPQGKPLL